jgi:hypothetical protein
MADIFRLLSCNGQQPVSKSGIHQSTEKTVRMPRNMPMAGTVNATVCLIGALAMSAVGAKV